MASLRSTKRDLTGLLSAGGWRESFASRLEGARPKDLVGPLFQLLMDKDELVRWRAVEAMGMAVTALADENMEAARVVMRQMLWRLNEESGNMGWGVAEAMGAVLAGHERLAKEFARILFSYVRHLGEVCHGNYLDNPMLRHGVYWGIGRLAMDRPELVRPIVPELTGVLDPAEAAEGKAHHEALECHDATSRGLVCWILEQVGRPVGSDALSALAARRDDAEPVRLFDGHVMTEHTVGGLAQKAFDRLKG